MTASRRFVEAVGAVLGEALTANAARLIPESGDWGSVNQTFLAESVAERLIQRGIGFVALGGSGTISSKPSPIVDARARESRTHDL